MRLTVVGCSGSFPGPDSAASCYLVESGGFALVLDLGNGALGPLQRYIGLDSVGAVYISHLHADHCADLCTYYVARRYRPGGPLPAIDVYGPAGTAEQVARAHGHLAVERLAELFSFQEVTGGALELGPFTVTTARTVHPVECYAVRVEADGVSLVYTADTAPSDSVTALARGADLLLAEASYVDGGDHPADLHLTGREAGEMARTAAVGRLVVTHVPPWNDLGQVRAESEAGLGRPCEMAVPGAVYEV